MTQPEKPTATRRERQPMSRKKKALLGAIGVVAALSGVSHLTDDGGGGSMPGYHATTRPSAKPRPTAETFSAKPNVRGESGNPEAVSTVTVGELPAIEQDVRANLKGLLLSPAAAKAQPVEKTMNEDDRELAFRMFDGTVVRTHVSRQSAAATSATISVSKEHVQRDAAGNGTMSTEKTMLSAELKPSDDVNTLAGIVEVVQGAHYDATELEQATLTSPQTQPSYSPNADDGAAVPDNQPIEGQDTALLTIYRGGDTDLNVSVWGKYAQSPLNEQTVTDYIVAAAA